MGVVLKMFIQSESADTNSFHLGAVCRGETNKDWAAATPGANADLVDPALNEVWAARQAGDITAAEVYVHLHEDPAGDFVMESCAFSYGGCSVQFRQHTPPFGKLTMTVNATLATESLRRSFAQGLLAGEAPKYRISVAADSA